MAKIGFLHPGEMGISLAASAQQSGQDVYWCNENRSAATQNRAEQHGLKAINNFADFCKHCEIIISVCPPHAAVDQAIKVFSAGFAGIYADVNAISPATVKDMAEKNTSAKIDFVDGGIIGLPAWQKGSTWLYLCGAKAEEVAQCFSGGLLATTILDGEIGQASALKMCFAAQNKGSVALLGAVLAMAEHHGIRDSLEAQWDLFNPGFAMQTSKRLQSVTGKAWRFSGEMEEIADTMKVAGLPDGFHLAAAEVFARQADFKDQTDAPALEVILKAILQH